MPHHLRLKLLTIPQELYLHEQPIENHLSEENYQQYQQLFSQIQIIDFDVEKYEGEDPQKRKIAEGESYQTGPGIAGLSPQKAAENAQKIQDILGNPDLVIDLLQDLDLELRKRCEAEGLHIYDISPEFLVPAIGCFFAGSCPPHFVPQNKRKLLSRILLEKEQAEGINLDGVPIFNDFVDETVADNFVKEGHLFAENEQENIFLYHSKFSHRLQFEILRQAMKRGLLRLETDDGRILSMKELLVMLIDYKMEQQGEMNKLWAILLDTFPREKNPDDPDPHSPLNPQNFITDCNSPFVVKSLITCLGAKLLPALSWYMLDSHYKQIEAMAVALEDKARTYSRLDPSQLEKILQDQNFLRTLIVAFVANTVSDKGIDSGIPFSNKAKSYIDYRDDLAGVVKKADTATYKDYDSVATYHEVRRQELESFNATKTLQAEKYFNKLSGAVYFVPNNVLRKEARTRFKMAVQNNNLDAIRTMIAEGLINGNSMTAFNDPTKDDHLLSLMQCATFEAPGNHELFDLLVVEANQKIDLLYLNQEHYVIMAGKEDVEYLKMKYPQQFQETEKMAAQILKSKLIANEPILDFLDEMLEGGVLDNNSRVLGNNGRDYTILDYLKFYPRENSEIYDIERMFKRKAQENKAVQHPKAMALQTRGSQDQQQF